MKDIPGFEGRYAVTEDGKVWSHPKQGYPTGTFLKPSLKGKTKNLYYQVWLWSKGKLHPKTVHRLVAIAYLSNPLNLRDVNHKNGIKTDNRVENLEWCSQLDNIRHAYANGLMPQDSRLGGKNPKAKMIAEEIIELRKLRSEGWKIKQLSEKFRLSISYTYKITVGKNWKHIL